MDLIAKRKSLFDELETRTDRIHSEGRNPNPEERKWAESVIEDIHDLSLQIDLEGTRAFMNESGLSTRSDGWKPGSFGLHSGGSSPRVGKTYRSFGDQLLAIRQAGIPGGQVDPKLYSVRAASGLSESVGPDGGFLVDATFSKEIVGSAFTSSQFTNLCRSLPLGPGTNSLKINAIAETSRVSTRWGGIVGYWLAEAATKTASAPKFRQIELNLRKLVCLCYATDELLEDAMLLDQTLRQGFAEEISFKTDEGIIRGTGVGQMLGILTSPALVSVARATASTISVADVTGMWSRLTPGSHQRATWIINPDALSALYQLTLGTTGQTPVFMPPGGLSSTPFPTLMGRPLIISEMASTLGTAGDLVLADLSHYLIISRGPKFDISMHVRFVNDESVYRAVLRIDGQPDLNSPVTPFKGSSALSPFVSLT